MRMYLAPPHKINRIKNAQILAKSLFNNVRWMPCTCQLPFTHHPTNKKIIYDRWLEMNFNRFFFLFFSLLNYSNMTAFLFVRKCVQLKEKNCIYSFIDVIHINIDQLNFKRSSSFKIVRGFLFFWESITFYVLRKQLKVKFATIILKSYYVLAKSNTCFSSRLWCEVLFIFFAIYLQQGTQFVLLWIKYNDSWQFVSTVNWLQRW